MKRLMFVLTVMVVMGVMMIGCNKSTKAEKVVQKDTLVGTWQIADESFEISEDVPFVVAFGDDGMMSVGMVKNGELELSDEKVKYTVDHNAKQFTVYKPSGEVDDVVKFEFISSDKLKTTGDEKDIYLLRFK